MPVPTAFSFLACVQTRLLSLKVGPVLTCVHELGIREGRSLSLQSLLAWRAKAAISANSEVGSQQLSDRERDPVTGMGNPKTRLELSPPVPPDGVGGRELEELLVGRAGQEGAHQSKARAVQSLLGGQQSNSCSSHSSRNLKVKSHIIHPSELSSQTVNS